MLELTDPDAKVITEESAKITSVATEFVPAIENPMYVYNEEGYNIGSAVVTLKNGSFGIELFLDHQTPERLDYEVNPEQIEAIPDLTVDATGIYGSVTVRRVKK